MVRNSGRLGAASTFAERGSEPMTLHGPAVVPHGAQLTERSDAPGLCLASVRKS